MLQLWRLLRPGELLRGCIGYAGKAAFHWRGLFAGLLLAAVPSAHLITAAGTLTFKTSDEIKCGENHHEDEAVSDKRSWFDDTGSGSIEPRPRASTLRPLRSSPKAFPTGAQSSSSLVWISTASTHSTTMPNATRPATRTESSTALLSFADALLNL